MNCTFMPSLEHITLVKITTIFWKQEGVSLHDKRKWDKIEAKIKNKVVLLPLPAPLTEKISGAIMPIGLRILSWMECIEHYEIDIDLPDELIWTPQGTLDKIKTAEALVKDDTLDIAKRYRIAHVFCLENEIETLWSKMSDDQITSIHNGKKPKRDVQHQLLAFFTHENGTEELARTQSALGFSAIFHGQVSTEYFWNKLTPKDRAAELDRILSHWEKWNWNYEVCRFDILHSLLSLANEEEQIIIIRKCPFTVLLCFLQWPRQSLFMAITNRVWEFLDDENYYRLLDEIVTKVMHGYGDYDYRKLFTEFWQKSDAARKKFVISECASKWLMLRLFEIKDVKNISLVLKDASAEEKENIICYCGINICRSLACEKEWHLIQFFIREFALSHEKMTKFTDKRKKELSNTLRKYVGFNNMNTLGRYPLLNEFIKKWSNERREK